MIIVQGKMEFCYFIFNMCFGEKYYQGTQVIVSEKSVNSAIFFLLGVGLVQGSRKYSCNLYCKSRVFSLLNMWSSLWSFSVCKIPQFLVKSYQFGQLVIILQKVETLMLLKIYIMFCPIAGAKYLFFRLQLMGHCFNSLMHNVPKWSGTF